MLVEGGDLPQSEYSKERETFISVPPPPYVGVFTPPPSPPYISDLTLHSIVLNI